MSWYIISIYMNHCIIICRYFIPSTILNRPVLYIVVDNLICFVLKIANWNIVDDSSDMSIFVSLESRVACSKVFVQPIWSFIAIVD